MTEQEALNICREKVAAHELEMKLVRCEIDANDNKTTFYFTADGRVDFRELVKDLAAVFHNRIELRQIGVRDEAKMIGGIGICGQPYCCKQFLPDFAPVSTKMAKVQSLSLNPTKISGSCGRLMCCLRYEEDAYECLVKTVPKQGAFVETPDGYGIAENVNVLRQRVSVRLDNGNEESLHIYPAKAVATVPGGRPKEGVKPPHVLHYDPSTDAEEEITPESEDPWASPVLFASETAAEAEAEAVVEAAPVAEEESTPEKAPSEEKQEKQKKRKFYFRGKGGKRPKGGAHAKK